MFQNFFERFPFIKQFAKFFVVGVMNTGVDFVILNILMYTTGQNSGVPYAFFKGLSFLAAVTLSYFINKHWTFQDKSTENNDKKFYQFILVSIVGAFINIIAATLVVTFIKPLILLPISGIIWGNIGALCGSASGLIWNFIGYKFIVFKK
ncbi:MAG: hypothetical protein UT50_C0021G0008 [Candidatus Moranbacteria bacterium GW2011_GWA2_39_41]|nr:MAG: hypothetical protein UT50_C0021G0008 [Candidatus Moranbacteria bacterium GW2011_GWA2_39_41]